MKRTLSLLVALALVFTMVPAVFATDDSVEFDELTVGMEENPQLAEIDVSYETAWDVHYYTLTPAEAGDLQFTVENGTVAMQDADGNAITANEDGTYTVAAETAYIVVVTKTDTTAATTWIAENAACEHTLAYTDNGDGTHDGTCSVCNEVVVDNEAHADEDSDNACDSCGAELIGSDTSLDVLQVDFVLGADIRGMFIMRQRNATCPYVSYYAEVNHNGNITRIEEYTTSSNSTFSFQGFQYTLAAKEMSDEITLTVFGVKSDGSVFAGTPKAWSAKAGAIAKMDTWYGDGVELDQAKCAMLANMLNYGAQAQKYFEYNDSDENLATYGLQDEYVDLIRTGTPEMSTWTKTSDSDQTVKLYQIDLILAEKVQQMIIFQMPSKSFDKNEYTAKITQTHIKSDGTEVVTEHTVDGSECIAANLAFGIYFTGLKSNDLRDKLSITLYQGETAVSATHYFSVDAVANGKMSTMGDLASALVHYGDCAKIVFD